MAITLTLGGVDVTAYLRIDSLDWSDNLNQRSSLSFDLLDPVGANLLVTEAGDYLLTEDGDYIATSAISYSIGSAVLLQDSGTDVFGGTVERFTAERLDEGSAALVVAIQCVSYDQLADKRLVADSYEVNGQTLGDVATDIVTTSLAGDGVTTGDIATGPVIGPVKWNYQRVSQALNDLSDLTGYAWWIDADKSLHFVARGAVAAPFTITTASGNFRRLRVETTRTEYRNRQYVKAGFGLTPSRTETIEGDGTRKTFVLAYPAGTEPTIPTKTFGIRGLETGMDWYWQKGDPVISQDDGATALGAGATLSVTYQGLYPILVNSQIDAEITARAAAEGGSGLYEELVADSNIDTEDAGLDKADALLRRYGHIPRTVTFETDTGGLRAGQLMAAVSVPELGLDGDWLIASVAARDVSGKIMRYTVTAWDGEALGGWVNFFAAMGNSAKSFEFRDNEVIVLLRRAEETVTATDAASYSSAAPESRADYALADYSEAA